MLVQSLRHIFGAVAVLFLFTIAALGQADDTVREAVRRAVTLQSSQELGKTVGHYVGKGDAVGAELLASAMVMTTPKRTERHTRHKQDSTLPTIQDVMAKVANAHGTEKLKESGVIKRSGTIKMPSQGREGTIRQWIDARRSRTEIELGTVTIIFITNGNDAAASTAGGPVERLDGAAQQQTVLAHPAIQFGGWQDGYAQLEVLKQIEQEGKKRWLIRATATDAPDATMIVDALSGRVIGGQQLEFMLGAGYIGLENTYSDFREIAGMTLPFHIESQYPHPLLGKTIIQYDSHEIGVTVSELFDLPPK